MTIKTTSHVVVAIADPPDVQAANPIHADSAAADYGYAGAIVAGISTYGWAVPAILESLGDAWLGHGWVELAFRRPVFVGDTLTSRVTPSADGAHGVLEQQGPDGRITIAGTVGLGDAPWKHEFVLPEVRDPLPPIENPKLTTPDEIPTDQDYRPMQIAINASENAQWCIERLDDNDRRWHAGAHPLVHPTWLVGQMTPLIYHSFNFPAGIHATGRVQHLLPLHATGKAITVAGRWRGKETRKGKVWSTSDAVFLAEDGSELAYVQQVAVILPPASH